MAKQNKKKKPFYNVVAESEPITYSTALEREYKNELKNLVIKMRQETEKVLLASYRRNESEFATDSTGSLIDKDLADLIKKFQDMFNQKADTIASKMFMRQFRYAKTKLRKILSTLMPTMPSENMANIMLKGSIFTKEMFPVYKAAIEENVNLIKSIPQQYFKQVTGSITRSMQFGGSLEGLQKDLMKIGDLDEWRAGFIAGDQSRKTFSAINLRNFQRAGIQKVKWVHSGGGQHPREYHARRWDGVSGIKDGKPNGLNGFIFDIDKPPVIQFATKTQPEQRGFPAQLPNCKCVLTAVAVIENES